MLNSILDDKLVYIAIGLQFRPNFLVEDKLGQIINSILYTKNSFFNTDFFTLIENANNQKRLTNNRRSNILTINSQNILLEIDNIEKNFSEVVIEKKFKEEVLNYILRECKLEGIGRIGYLRRYQICDVNIVNIFDKKIDFGENLQDVNLRFSKRLMTSQSVTNKDNNDYFNLIYNFSKSNTKDVENKLTIGIDTQKYFNPTANYEEFLCDDEYSDFIHKVKYYNGDNFINWFKKYSGVSDNDTIQNS